MSALNMALKSLGRRKLRTTLTVSSIVVGIAMTLVFLSLVAGMDIQAAQMVRAIGGADITVVNATRMTRQQFQQGLINTLDESLVTVIEGVNGVYDTSSQLSLRMEVNGTGVTINGIEPSTYSAVTGGLNIINGSSLSEGSEKEVVLGKILADSLNATIDGNVIISSAQQDGESYKIIGIYETGIALQDRGCYITLEEVQNMSNKENLITAILVKCVDPNEVPTVRETIANLLPEVRIVSPTAAIQQVSNLLNTVRMFLFSIGLIALMAGGFGVVNTMITSISERTREIGTLKAIGAKDQQILKIFMSEALLLGVIGGGFGVSIGIIFSILFPMFSGGLSALPIPIIGGGGPGGGSRFPGGVFISPAIIPTNVLLCFSLGIVVGVLAGLYPAWRAARMRPVEALRRV